VTIVLLVVATVCFTRFFTASTSEAALVEPSVAPTLDATIAQLESAVAAQPTDGRSWQKLGAAYVQKLVQSANPAYADLTRRALDQAAGLLQNDIATIVTRAQLALTLHQFADARTLGQQAHDVSARSNDALVVLVDANVELGRYDEAATDLQELLDRKPGLAALSRVSYLRELNGDVDGALSALREAQNAAAGASPFDIATVDSIRGDLLYNHGRIDEADVAYSDALTRSPEQLVATAGRARVLVTHGDLAGATALLAPVADRFPTPTLVTLLGDIATLDGRTADARRSFDVVRATTALQKAGGAAVDLEASLFEADHSGDPALVLQLATDAYATRPSIHGADALAWARLHTNDLAGASSSIAEALRLGTRDASLLFHAAAIHSAAGSVEQARAELTDALTINPWFAIGNRSEVSALAARLGVAVPEEWGQR
jgi:tetratricopeptide (TPR) repeat protein